jgi:autotransporter-associated beta strand protein
LRIFTTTIPTDHKLYTLMHDAVYRNAIAWQNTAYNQPPHAGFYIGDDMDTPPAPSVYSGEKRWQNGKSSFENKDRILFDITAGQNANINLPLKVSPDEVKVNSPYDVEIGGSGSLSGKMRLNKTGAGNIVFNNSNDYSGKTSVWSGTFYNNGNLPNSEVRMYSFSCLAGKGSFGNNVTLGRNTAIEIGEKKGEISKITFRKSLVSDENATYNFDIETVKNADLIKIEGDWKFAENTVFNISITGKIPKQGKIELVNCKGNIIGNLQEITVAGLPETLKTTLVQKNKSVILEIE